MKRRGIIDIAISDANADWIKTEENRKAEAKIHEQLAKRLGKGKPKEP